MEFQREMIHKTTINYARERNHLEIVKLLSKYHGNKDQSYYHIDLLNDGQISHKLL